MLRHFRQFQVQDFIDDYIGNIECVSYDIITNTNFLDVSSYLIYFFNRTFSMFINIRLLISRDFRLILTKTRYVFSLNAYFVAKHHWNGVNDFSYQRNNFHCGNLTVLPHSEGVRFLTFILFEENKIFIFLAPFVVISS